MTSMLRVLSCTAMLLCFSGCTTFIPMEGIDGSGTVNRSLTKELVKEGIIEGANSAAWRANDIGDDKIVASYRIRAHTVVVEISYTEDSYEIEYKSSTGMKVFCSEEDWKAARNIRVTGGQTCPGKAVPPYIHGNYEKWINSLKQSIDEAIAFVK